MRKPSFIVAILIAGSIVFSSCGKKKEVTSDNQQKNDDQVKITNVHYSVTTGKQNQTKFEFEEKDLDQCESDSVCKTINVTRSKTDEIELRFPCNKIETELTMYSDMKMKEKIMHMKGEKGDDEMDLTFSKIEDGDYKIVLQRKGLKKIFKLIVATEA